MQILHHHFFNLSVLARISMHSLRCIFGFRISLSFDSLGCMRLCSARRSLSGSRGRFLWNAVQARRSANFMSPAHNLFPASSLRRFLWIAVEAHSSAYFMPRSLFPVCRRGRILWTRVQTGNIAHLMSPSLLPASSKLAVVNVFYGLSFGPISLFILYFPACLRSACNEFP